MEVTFSATIPDNVAAEIQNGSKTPLARCLLELAAIKAYETDLITEREVMEMLRLESREDLYKLFKAYDVRDHYFTLEELDRGRATLSAILDK